MSLYKNMGFKTIQEQPDQPKYCDYIQQKVDVAKEHNAVYELVDEDNRIQALYDDENLLTKEYIKQIKRVKINEKNGKEFLVINKTIDFHTRDEKDANEIGAYKDRYVEVEGIVEIPVKTSNPNSESNPTRLEYTIPFTKENLNKYANKNDGIIYGFYEGSTTSTRTPTVIPTVTNLEYFRDATWDELLLGREKKVLNSMVNRLPEIRKELGSPKEEVNKKEEVKENSIDTKKEEETGGKTTIIEPSNTASKSSSNSGGSSGSHKRS